MRVVIVGGGVGGLALAYGLRRRGVEVVVLERYDAPATGGAAVTLYSNGLAALAGLGADTGDLGAPIAALEVRRATGALALRADLSRMADRFGFGVRTVPRRLLLNRLGADDPRAVRYGQAVVEVLADKPAVRTADGTVHEGDVVVGADGHRSIVRASVLDPEPASEVGWATWQGLTPVLPDIADGRTGVLTVGAAGLVGTMPAGAGLCQWWFDVRGDTSSPTPLADLRAGFADYAEPVPSLLCSIEERELSGFRHVLHKVRPQWGTGAVTLIGDAAHAFPPSQAQGANQALEDACMLQRALTATPAGADLPDILRSVEGRRAARVRIVSRLAASERTNKPASPLLAVMTGRIPASMAGAAYARLVRRFSSVLTDDAGAS